MMKEHILALLISSVLCRENRWNFLDNFPDVGRNKNLLLQHDESDSEHTESFSKYVICLEGFFGNFSEKKRVRKLDFS